VDHLAEDLAGVRVANFGAAGRKVDVLADFACSCLTVLASLARQWCERCRGASRGWGRLDVHAPPTRRRLHPDPLRRNFSRRNELAPSHRVGVTWTRRDLNEHLAQFLGGELSVRRVRCAFNVRVWRRRAAYTGSSARALNG